MDLDDDPVVKELDVYVAKALEKQLSLLQFTLRDPSKPYNGDKSPVAARFKNKVNMLQVEVPIESSPRYYNEANGADFSPFYKPIRENPVEGGLMQHQVLSSTLVPAKTHYFVGVMDKDQLHLTGIHTTLQMRPSFGYIDEKDAQQAKDAKAKSDDEEEEEEDINDGKAIQVVIKKRESERAQAARKRSHAYLQKQVDDDPWVPLTYYDFDTEEAERVYGYMFSQSVSDVPLETDTANYLKVLVPPPAVSVTPEISAPHGKLSVNELRSLNLDAQVKTLLQRSNVITFTRLTELIQVPKPPLDILAALDKNGLYIKGVWVAKSELLNLSYRIGLARDYLLYLFSSKAYVQRKEMNDSLGIKPDDIKDLLTPLGKLYAGHGWQLKLERDDSQLGDDFASACEQLETSHKESLAARGKAVEKELKSMKKADKDGGAKVKTLKEDISDVTIVSGGSSSSARRASVSVSAEDVSPVKKELGGSNATEQLKLFLREVFKAFGNCDKAFIEEQVHSRTQAIDVPKNLINPESVSADLLASTLAEVSMPLKSDLVARSVGNEQADKLRNLLVDMYTNGGKSSYKKTDMSQKFAELSGTDMEKGIPTALFNKSRDFIISQSGGGGGGGWILKPTNRPVSQAGAEK